MKQIKLLTTMILFAGAVSMMGCSDENSANFTLKGATSAGSGQILAVSSPSSFKVKVYAFWVSTSALCTDPIKVFEDETPDYQEFTASPTLANSTIASGDYPCIIMEMSDVLKFTPNSTDGSCTGGVEQSIQVCRTASSANFLLPGGSETACTDSEQRIAVYMSTASTATDGGSGINLFVPPASVGDATKGLRLASALSVSGSQTSTFIVNPTNKVDGSNAECDMLPPSFGFN